MDLDDLIEDLVPKKQYKKLKKKFKKKSILGLIFAWLAALFSNRQDRDYRESRDDREDRDYKKDRPKRDSREYKKDRSKRYEPTKQPSVNRSKPDVRTNQPAPQKANDPLIASLEQAQTYRMNIEAMALSAEPDSIERLRLDLLSDRVTEWTLMIEQIVERALSHQEDELLAAERKRVPEAIQRLEKQLAKAKDAAIRAKLEKTLENRRKQLVQLEQSSNNRQMAELKVENTLAQLGIIYSQLHNGQHVAGQSGYDRLSAEISEEVHVLEDYLDAYQALNQ